MRIQIDLELSPRTKRLLKVGVPLALLLAGGSVALASVPNTFKDGDLLSAQAMNDNFSSLDTRLTAVEGLAGNTIFCTAKVTLPSGVGPFSHTFAAAECGGTLPGAAYRAMPTSWVTSCNGVAMLTALQDTDAGLYPGFSGYWDFGGCAGTNYVTVSVLYVKR